jgi:hypothetical protein
MMKGRGMGLEIWQVEGTERAKVWGVNNIKVDIRGYVCKTSIMVQDRQTYTCVVVCKIY